jgi:outer membrane protein
MKKSHLLVCSAALAALLVLPGWVGAAEKIGYIDVREVVFNTDAGKKASEEMKKVRDKYKSTIQAQQAELEKMKSELDKQRSILNEATVKEKDQNFQKKLRDYQLLVKDANDDMQSREQELSNTILPEIFKVVHTIGEKEKYTMILDIGTIAIYRSKETFDNNLTKRVIEEFNKTYKPNK